MKDNLFIVRTYYQLLGALNMSLKVFNSNEFANEIIWLKRADDVTQDSLHLLLNQDNIIVHSFPGGLFPELIRLLRSKTYYQFIFFQENDIFCKYLGYCLKKRGCRLLLGPDGTKPYGVFNKKYEVGVACKDTLLDYRNLYKNKFWLSKLVLSWNYRYGSFKLLDEVWLQNVPLFNNKQNRTVGVLKQLPEVDSETIALLKAVIAPDIEIPVIRNSIIYFNQPLWSQILIDKEIEVIRKIRRDNPDKPFYVKFHPATNQEIKDFLIQQEKVVFLDLAVPAEFIVNCAEHCQLVTPWSTSLIHPLGLNNSYYYLYNEFVETSDAILNQFRLAWFDHIQTWVFNDD